MKEEIIKFFTDNESDVKERKITLEYWNKYKNERKNTRVKDVSGPFA